MSYPPPPPVPGTVAPRGRDAGPMWWWSVKGRWYQAFSARATVGERIQSAAVLTGLLAGGWLLVPWQAIGCWRGRPRFAHFYLDEARCACIGVAVDRKGWVVCEHWCRRPGTGQAAPLRRAVCGALVAAADEAAVPIRVTAASRAIVSLYERALPGALLDVPGGRKLARRPAAREIDGMHARGGPPG